MQTLSRLFSPPQDEPDIGLLARTVQRNDTWLGQLGASPESRVRASQHSDLQREISTLLDADPPVVVLSAPAGGGAVCVFLAPDPTRETLERLAWIGQTLFQFNDPVAARLLATACEAARQGFPDREAALLRDCGLALQNSQAGLPLTTLMALSMRAAELIDLGFLSKDDGLLFEAAACRSPQGAAYGLNLSLRRIRAELKALSDQAAPSRQADAIARLGREIANLHQQCCALDEREPALAAIGLLKDLLALAAEGSPVHTTLSDTLGRLLDVHDKLFDMPRSIAAWYPGLLKGGDPALAAQAYLQRLDVRSVPAHAPVRHEQLCTCLSALVQHWPDMPWSIWSGHLQFAARAFPLQHHAHIDTGLCLTWVCAQPGAEAERLDTLWACMAAAPDPRKALSPQDTERLLVLMLRLPADAAMKAWSAYLALVHPQLGSPQLSNPQLKPLWALLSAHRGLAIAMPPQEILAGLVHHLLQAGRMTPMPEWDVLVRRLLGTLLSRDHSLEMADAPALGLLVLNFAVSSPDPLAALDSAIELMRCIRQAVQAPGSPTGAARKGEASFLARFGKQLEHQPRFGGQDPSKASGVQRHVQQLLGACLSALEEPRDPTEDKTARPVDPAEFTDVYLSLVRARLAQQAGNASAQAGVERTIERLRAILECKVYLSRLDRIDPTWGTYSGRLRDTVEALAKAQTAHPT